MSVTAGTEVKRLMDMPTRATVGGTTRFRARIGPSAGDGFYRQWGGLTLSVLGIGTYLGETNTYTDDLVHDAVVEAVRLGANVIDTAINYRYQRSERAIGRALHTLYQGDRVERDELFISTKGGFVPFDRLAPVNPVRHLQEKFLSTGILPLEELVGGCHSLHPRFLCALLDRSLENLRLGAVDLYYLHNPETQLMTVDKPEFERRMRRAFQWLESEVLEGRIACYGTATWIGYRKRRGAKELLSLAALVRLAREVAGSEHHFRAIQLPLSLMMPEAVTLPNQIVDDEVVTILEAAERLGVGVFVSGPLAQGLLVEGLPGTMRRKLPDFPSDAQRSLYAVTNVPGVTSVLVGMKKPKHVKENLELRSRPRGDWALLQDSFW